jgi:cytochrome c553
MKKLQPLIFLLGLSCFLLFNLALPHLTEAAVADSSASAEQLAKIEKNREDAARCLRCHGAEGLKTSLSGDIVSLFIDGKTFQESMHESLSCRSCHVGMTDYPHAKIKYSQSFRASMNKNCQYCHKEITAQYKESVHGQQKQGKTAALCTDCHGAHNIFKKTDSRSQVYAQNQVQACAKCHTEKQDAYNWGVHGKAVALGSNNKAATCATCHTAHEIQGPDKTNSTVNDQNLNKTCSQCHPRATVNMSKGMEHYTLTSEGENAPMYYTYKAFSILLVAVVTLFLLYILLDLYRRIRNLKKKPF